jgi:hypothetical protein
MKQKLDKIINYIEVFLEKQTFLKYLLPCIIIVGIIGNLINLMVFGKKNMRQASTFRFLFYLSAADLLVISACALDLHLGFHYAVEPRFTRLSCKLVTFFTYFLTHASSFILMIISVDRALIISNKSFSLLFKRNRKAQAKESKFKSPKSSKQHAIVETKNNRRNLVSSSSLVSFGQAIAFYCGQNVHRVDKVILKICAFLFLLNFHYIIFLDLRIEKDVDFIFNSNVKEVIFNAMSKRITHDSSMSNMLEEATNLTLHHAKINTTHLFGAKQYLDLYEMPNSYYFENMNKTNQFQFNITIFENMKQHGYICHPVNGTIYYTFLEKIWVWIDISVYALIPFVVMSVCSAIILIRIRKKSHTYFTKLLNKNKASDEPHFVRRLRRNRQLLYMLLATNLFFLICITPFCICSVIMNGKSLKNTSIQLIVHILVYMNNALNFLLYGFSSRKYREELAKVFFISCLNKGNKNKNSKSKTQISKIQISKSYRRRDSYENSIEANSRLLTDNVNKIDPLDIN